MTNFVFKADSLYDPDAAPDPSEGYLHEDPDLGQRLAKQKRLAVWLRDKLKAHGIVASNLVWDEGGWSIKVNGDDGFAFVILDRGGGGEKSFDLVVAQIGDAKLEHERTCAAFEAILQDNPEIELIETAH